ncbi:hypothetical protein [Rhizobium phaseoli]|uniref:Uncharacterized protein n=1 Tax=Rhizobium phaseoli TaxID=396 RepID=A0ABM6CFS8_9HYPH|nr:hypothetical protein [Rhizobium phaseoli]ANL87128.1 hypothetical protein AMC81_PA00107 [Rhizobium phaseoli]ANL93637.1 hypothetical protein AMC80_PA00107 [Rhizobium phaseoli]
MFKDTVDNTVARAGDYDGDFVLRLRREGSQFYFANRNARPTVAEYRAAAQYLTDSTDVEFDTDAIKAILSLYPSARIDLAAGYIQETHVRDALKDAIANFFLSCDWPRGRDKVDIDAFLAVLHRQAEAMGYTVAEPDQTVPPPTPSNTFQPS